MVRTARSLRIASLCLIVIVLLTGCTSPPPSSSSSSSSTRGEADKILSDAINRIRDDGTDWRAVHADFATRIEPLLSGLDSDARRVVVDARDVTLDRALAASESNTSCSSRQAPLT